MIKPVEKSGLWCISVRWQEPEDGVCTYGPYPSAKEAQRDIVRVVTTYHLTDVDPADYDQAFEEWGLVPEVMELIR